MVLQARTNLIQAIETGDISQLVDPRLEKHYVEGEMFRMIETAAACVRHSAPKRPRMAQVVLMTGFLFLSSCLVLDFPIKAITGTNEKLSESLKTCKNDSQF